MGSISDFLGTGVNSKRASFNRIKYEETSAETNKDSIASDSHFFGTDTDNSTSKDKHTLEEILNTRNEEGYFARLESKELAEVKKQYNSTYRTIDFNLNKTVTQVPKELRTEFKEISISEIDHEKNRKSLNSLFKNPKIAKYLEERNIKSISRFSIYSSELATEKLKAIQKLLNMDIQLKEDKYETVHLEHNPKNSESKINPRNNNTQEINIKLVDKKPTTNENSKYHELIEKLPLSNAIGINLKDIPISEEELELAQKIYYKNGNYDDSFKKEIRLYFRADGNILKKATEPVFGNDFSSQYAYKDAGNNKLESYAIHPFLMIMANYKNNSNLSDDQVAKFITYYQNFAVLYQERINKLINKLINKQAQSQIIAPFNEEPPEEIRKKSQSVTSEPETSNEKSTVKTNKHNRKELLEFLKKQSEKKTT